VKKPRIFAVISPLHGAKIGRMTSAVRHGGDHPCGRIDAMASDDRRHLCERCRERKARFSHGGVVKADRSHTLCFACFRSERDRLRARLLAETPVVRACREPLTPSQRAHRFRMLAHLRATSRRGM
jgi:hypothetical protein